MRLHDFSISLESGDSHPLRQTLKRHVGGERSARCGDPERARGCCCGHFRLDVGRRKDLEACGDTVKGHPGRAGQVTPQNVDGLAGFAENGVWPDKRRKPRRKAEKRAAGCPTASRSRVSSCGCVVP